MISRTGPLWDFIAGRQSAPAAAETLSWELSWVAPEPGEILAHRDGHSAHHPPGNARVFRMMGRSGLRRATTSNPCPAKADAVPTNRLPV